MAVVVSVAERRMWGIRLGVNAQLFPALEIAVCYLSILVLIVGQPGDPRHGFETDDALDGQVRLVAT